MARTAVFRAETDDGPDVLRWLDRMLIRLVSPGKKLLTVLIVQCCTNVLLLAPCQQVNINGNISSLQYKTQYMFLKIKL